MGIIQTLLLLTLCTPADRPLVAEVFYDAIGADTDLEFVEIFNPAPTVRSLEGLRLEAGNGSESGDWTLRWVGEAGDSLPPGARFVIGGASVRPLPHAVARLSLQNGPDAVRLVWPDGAIEVVGYGAHEFDEYFCQDAAVDVAAGQSLARIPDDARTGANATDFRPAAPSPGRPNQAQRDVAWLPGSLALVPEQPGPGETATLSGMISNAGREDVAAGELGVSVVTRGVGDEQLVIRTVLDSALSASDTAHIALALTLPVGKQTIEARLELQRDEAAANDRDSLRVRAGPGPLAISEIQFHPRYGEGEWIEVRNRTSARLDLSLFELSDRGGARGRIEGFAPCDPESLAVLAQSREALLLRYPALDPLRVWSVRPWPALNNYDDASGIADLVVLREADGTQVERHAYSAANVPSGVPIEQREGFWWPSLDPAGSPLALPRASAAGAPPFALAPRRVVDGESALRLSWALPWPRGSVSFELYDLDGGWVGRLFSANDVPGRAEIEHALPGVAAGLYVVVMRARPQRGTDALVSSRALRVSGTTR